MIYPDIFNFDVSEINLRQLRDFLSGIFVLLKDTM